MSAELDFKPEPVQLRDAKKMKVMMTSAKADWGIKKADYLDEEVEHRPRKTPRKTPGKKPVSQAASKIIPKDERPEEKGPGQKKVTMNKSLSKILGKAKGGNSPGMWVKLSAAQMEGHKAAKAAKK
ncbi:hypothetical protein PMIN07_011957 [Paraphaeosphaeria minitans]